MAKSQNMYKIMATTQDCKNNGNITGYVQDNDNNTRLYKIMVEYVQDNGNTTELGIKRETLFYIASGKYEGVLDTQKNCLQ